MGTWRSATPATRPPAARVRRHPTVDPSAAEPLARGRKMIRNLPIRAKLIGILIAPLLALTLLTSLGIGANLAIKVQAGHLLQETAFANTLSRLVHELQDERDLTAGGAEGNPANDGAPALEAFRKDTQALEDDGSPFYGKVQTARAALGRLAQVRQGVEDNATSTTAQQVLDY